MGPKEEALKILDEFNSTSRASAFAGVSQVVFIEGLRERIKDPTKINQGGANLCGPAAFLYDLASRDPVSYTTFALNLYEKGEAKIGKFHIKPNDSLKKYKLPTTGNPPHPADWIPMASIRNSKGSFVFWDTYDNLNDEGSGITPPWHLSGWMYEVGYGQIVDRTSVTGLSNSDAKKRLQEAVDRDNQGYKVFLLILAALLNDSDDDDSKQAKKAAKGKTNKASKSFGTFPNHWVILESGIVTEMTAKLEVYSWGGKMSIPPAGENWSLDHIAARFYGYIAGKY